MKNRWSEDPLAEELELIGDLLAFFEIGEEICRLMRDSKEPERVIIRERQTFRAQLAALKEAI